MTKGWHTEISADRKLNENKNIFKNVPCIKVGDKIYIGEKPGWYSHIYKIQGIVTEVYEHFFVLQIMKKDKPIFRECFSFNDFVTDQYRLEWLC